MSILNEATFVMYTYQCIVHDSKDCICLTLYPVKLDSKSVETKTYILKVVYHACNNEESICVNQN